MMNIENLKVGMEFKSYKALCEFLGEPVKGGDAKKVQLRKWQEYFTWSKVGNKFIISTVGEKVDIQVAPTQIKDRREINVCQLSVVEGEAYSMEELVKYFLDEEIKCGNSYARQRAQVECCGRFIYQNGKWFVKEIYDIEIERKDGRSSKCTFNPNGDINKILTIYFWLAMQSANQKAMTISIPKLEMLCLLGLTNNNFKHLRYENNGLKELGYDNSYVLMRDIQSWGESKIGTLSSQLIKKGIVGASQINWRTLVLRNGDEYINVIATSAQVNELELLEDEAVKCWNISIVNGYSERKQLFSFKDVKLLDERQKTEFYGILNKLIKNKSKTLPSNYAYNYKCYNFLTNELKVEKALKKFGVDINTLTIDEVKQVMYSEIANINDKHIEIQLRRFFDTLEKAQGKELNNAEVEAYEKQRIKRLGSKAPVRQELTVIENYVIEESYENIGNLIDLLLNNKHELTTEEENVVKIGEVKWERSHKKITVED